MKNNTFITRLTRSAVASSLAAGWLVPEKYSAITTPPLMVREAVVTDQANLPQESSHPESEGLLVVNLPEVAREWTRKMEREFRRLALSEAKGTLSAVDSARLEELSLLRERLHQPRPAEEVLRQLKRDRLLERISETLRQYVEFQEGAGKKRSPAA